MVNLSALASLNTCLSNICAGSSGCVAFADDISTAASYKLDWVKPYNLAIDVTPAAVIRPNSTEEVAAAVRCAADNGYKVQARSGGHSFANFGLGDGALTIDLVNMQKYSMDETTWYATIGAGMKLGDVDTHLTQTGRAFAHGVCPGVGIGGHATIIRRVTGRFGAKGGLGPMSRMWGTTLDHIVEVEVVIANGTILRATEDENSDLFFNQADDGEPQGLRGAGASFGIITEFVMRTHPAPGDAVQYSFEFDIGGDAAELASTYMAWQDLVADPDLDRRFGTELILWSGGIIITGTFYGTQGEFEASGIQQRLPENGTITLTDWLGSLAEWVEKEALYLSNLPSDFYAKSLGFRQEDMLTEENVTALFKYTNELDKGTLVWFIIFDATGGAVADVPMNATGYAHRNKLMFYQSYAVDILYLSDTTRSFLIDFYNKLVTMMPADATNRGTYPGYVDLNISGIPQEQYWEGNLPMLETIKSKWDPDDVFHNPQSVRPS
ncbi:putative FAD-linked oxidoreductase YvdP [Cytospora mali]|uniref:FAD-linked oxidoreductase YvdP n=1 Tax=Cytospora mali TaxID=578113 RepID=A0A194W903_CYTMA|nr:putative FAD-linked oxidoreductase YvdP [Valsa mali]